MTRIKTCNWPGFPGFSSYDCAALAMVPSLTSIRTKVGGEVEPEASSLVLPARNQARRYCTDARRFPANNARCTGARRNAVFRAKRLCGGSGLVSEGCESGKRRRAERPRMALPARVGCPAGLCSGRALVRESGRARQCQSGRKSGRAVSRGSGSAQGLQPSDVLVSQSGGPWQRFR
jgi:hypothetical protein